MLDTNVVVSFFLSRRLLSASARIFQLWFKQRRLQLIVSAEVVAEYLEVLDRLGIQKRRIEHFAEVLQKRATVTHVNLGSRFKLSRDPDDNLMLAMAAVGKAEFLITHDDDLLKIPATQQKRLRFEIVTPGQFLARME